MKKQKRLSSEGRWLIIRPNIEDNVSVSSIVKRSGIASSSIL